MWPTKTCFVDFGGNQLWTSEEKVITQKLPK